MALLVASSGLAACAEDGSNDAGADAAADAVVVPAEVGTGIHDVTAPVVGGGTISLTDYRDEPLALWFWAPT